MIKAMLFLLAALGLGVCRILRSYSVTRTGTRTGRVGFGLVLLACVGLAQAQTTFWDGVNTTPNNNVDGGNSLWTPTGTNWTTSDGSANGVWPGGTSIATFQGAIATVQVNGTMSIGGLNFLVDGSAVRSGFLTGAAGNNTLNAGAGVTANLRTILQGGNGFEKTGPGKISLTNTHTYTGPTTVTQGTLSVGDASGAALPGFGTGDINSTSGVSIASGAFLNFQANSYIFNRVISGAGSVRNIGPGGNLTLTADSTYTGSTEVTLNGVSLVLGNGGSTGSISSTSNIILSGGNTSSLIFNRNNALVVPSVISGVGRVFQNGTGVTSLTGASTYPGQTRINAGTLSIGNGGSTGSIDSTSDFSVVAGTTLVVNRNNSFTLIPVVNGGNFTQQGIGTTILTNAVNASGAIAINAGILSVGNGGSSGSLNGTGVAIASGANLTYNTSSAVNAGYVISGAGSLTQLGAGVTTLTQFNTYTGATTITNGTLQLTANPNTLSTSSVVSVGTGATLDLNGRPQTSPRVTSTGTVALGANGTLTLTSGASSIGAITGTGTIVVNSGAALTLTAALVNSGVNITLAGGTLSLGAFTHSMAILNVTSPSTMDFGGAGTAQITAASLTPTAALNVTSWTFGTDHFFATSVTPTPAKDTANVSPLNNITLTGLTSAKTAWLSSNNEITVLNLTFWDGTNTTANGLVNGGNGTWDGTTTNWTQSTGTPNGAWAAGTNVATFQTTGGTVNVSGTQSMGGLTFKSSGYTLNGGNLTGAAGTNPLTADPGVSATVGSVLAGGNPFSKEGAGTVSLTASNTYTGATTVNAGTLAFGTNLAASSFNSPTTVASGAKLLFSGTGGVTSGAAATISLASGATLENSIALGNNNRTVLPGAVTVAGTTTIAQTAVTAPSVQGLYIDGGLRGSGAVTINAPNAGNSVNFRTLSNTFTGTLLVTGVPDPTALSGSGIGVSGAGTSLQNTDITLNGTMELRQGGIGANNLDTTTFSMGALNGSGVVVGNAGSASTHTMTMGVTNNPGTFSGVIANGTNNTQSITKVGTNTQTLTGTNTYTGATTVSAGTLVAGSNTALGSTAAGTTVASGATLALPGGITIGAEALTLSGTGVSSVGALSNTAGANTYGGAITLAAAATIGSPAGTLTLSGTVANGGFGLTLDGAGNITAGGAIGGTGALTKTGSGTALLSAANTYTGASTVAAGTLLVNGSLATGSTVTVQTGAILGGSGSMGPVIVNTGGHLAPGNSPGTITMTSLTVASTANLDMELGQANVVGGTKNDLIVVNGNVALNGGTLNIAVPTSPAGTFTAGTYRLINYTGTLSGTGLVLGTIPAGFTASQLTIDTSTAGQVNLIVVAVTGTLWDGSNTTANSIVDGGNGTWDATTSNWTQTGGTTNGQWAAGTSVATFQTTGGTVNVTGIQSIGGLTFNTSGYTLSGGTLSGAVVGPAASILTADPSVSATVGSVLAGPGPNPFSKSGTGTITLTGANTYDGAMTLTAGTLIAGNNAALGTTAAGTSVNSGATLALPGGIDLGIEALTLRGLGVGSAGALLNMAGDNSSSGTIALAAATSVGSTAGTLTLNGVMSGLGNLTKFGLGTVRLNGANTYSNQTIVNAGTLIAGNATALGPPGSGTTVNSGATLALPGGITIGAEALTLVGSGAGGVGALSNTMGANTYGGAITLGAGATIGSTAGTLTLSSTVDNGGFILTLDGAGAITASGAISGAGALTKTGSGTALLNAANGYTGSTTVSGGTLQLGVNSALASSTPVSIASGATLDVNGMTQTLATIANSGTLALGTTGNLTVASLTSTGTLAMGAGGSNLTLTSGTHSIGAITGTGTITVGPGATLTLTAALANSGVNIVLDGGTLNLGVFTHAMGTLSLTQASTLDFASAGAAQLTAATLNPAFALNVTNWTQGADHFFASAVTGNPARSSTNISPLNNITLTGRSALETAWLSSNEIVALPAPPTIAKVFSPATVGTGVSSLLTITLSNQNATVLTAAAFTDSYPPGLVNAATPAGTTTCTGGTVTAVAGNTSVALSGGTIPANNFCTVTVSVISATAGSYTNTIAIGALTSSGGSNAAAATAILTVGAPATFWDGSNTSANSLVDGGNGTWDAATSNWTVSDGTTNGLWAAGTNVATFQATAGTVTVSSPQSIGGLTFNTDGYTLSGGTLSGAAPTNTLTAGTGINATVGSVLAGSNVFDKAGAGAITLTGANTYSGATTVSAGTLILGNVAALGSTAAGTTVSSGATLALPGGISIGAEALTLSGSGAGAVGALSNTMGANTYGGTITLGAGATIGSTAGTLTLGSTVDNGGFILTLDGAGAITASGIISGAGVLTKTGTGTALLNAANTYTNTTAVSGGTLRLGVNSALPATAVTVATGATLDVNGMTQSLPLITSAGTLALGTNGSLTLTSGASTIGAITGSGTITVGSGASLTLTQALVNSGVNIVLAGGTLNLGALTHSMGALSLTAASTLDFDAGTAQLTAATLNPAFALNVTNWTLGTDHFMASTVTGSPARNTGNISPLNNITLTGRTADKTVWLTSNEISIFAALRVRVAKVSNGGVGSFTFALNGLSTTADNITTVTSGVAVQGAAAITGTPGTAATVTESGVPSGWPANPAAASCVDANGAASGNGAASFGTLAGNVLTIAAGKMVDGADITCTFTNSLRGISGTVFKDNGAPVGTSNTGTPNDGLKNGSETGLAGLAVSLTNCAATTYGTTSTDSNGAYSLDIPAAVVTSAAVCVTAGLPSSYLATGASVSGTATPDGSTTTVGAIAYTYSRAQQRQAFAAPASGALVLDFGAVAPSSFVLGSAQSGQPGTSATYPHTFTAQTGGAVSFSVTSSTATPAQSGWSEKIYADAGCTGILQSGAVLLYPPAAAVTVVAGQQVCILVQQIIPAAAVNGNNNTAVVQANLSFANAAPSMFATYVLNDITTVGNTTLGLRKEVRNFTQLAPWGVSNQAKSGEVLEYRITYINNSAAPLTKVVLNDAVPAYTTFQSATAGPVPTGAGNCTMNTPVNPLPAVAVPCSPQQTGSGTGTLQWALDGTLNPTATGFVQFRVVVD